MRTSFVLVLSVSAAHEDPKEPAVKRVVSTSGFIDKKLVTWVDNIMARRLTASSLHIEDIDNAMVGKLGHLTTPGCPVTSRHITFQKLDHSPIFTSRMLRHQWIPVCIYPDGLRRKRRCQGHAYQWFRQASKRIAPDLEYQTWDRDACTQRALEHADRSNATEDDGQLIWNFAFGSNLSPAKLRGRGMRPVKIVRGVLPKWSLLFNHRGGYGNIEEVAKIKNERYDVSKLEPLPQEVHGVLLLLKRTQFAQLAREEYAYDTVEVPVQRYGQASDVKQVQYALAFKTHPCAIINSRKLPTSRYIRLIREGARARLLEPSYCKWLESIPVD